MRTMHRPTTQTRPTYTRHRGIYHNPARLNVPDISLTRIGNGDNELHDIDHK